MAASIPIAARLLPSNSSEGSPFTRVELTPRRQPPSRVTASSPPIFLTGEPSEPFSIPGASRHHPSKAQRPHGHPCVSMIRSHTRRASTDSLNRVCSGTSPGDHRFPEPEAHPKTVTAGTPPETTLRGRRPPTNGHVFIQALIPPPSPPTATPGQRNSPRQCNGAAQGISLWRRTLMKNVPALIKTSHHAISEIPPPNMPPTSNVTANNGSAILS